jgi:hypothetical protein
MESTFASTLSRYRSRVLSLGTATGAIAGFGAAKAEAQVQTFDVYTAIAPNRAVYLSLASPLFNYCGCSWLNESGCDIEVSQGRCYIYLEPLSGYGCAPLNGRVLTGAGTAVGSIFGPSAGQSTGTVIFSLAPLEHTDPGYAGFALVNQGVSGTDTYFGWMSLELVNPLDFSEGFEIDQIAIDQTNNEAIIAGGGAAVPEPPLSVAILSAGAGALALYRRHASQRSAA